MPAAPLRALGYTSAGGCFASIGRNGKPVSALMKRLGSYSEAAAHGVQRSSPSRSSTMNVTGDTGSVWFHQLRMNSRQHHNINIAQLDSMLPLSSLEAKSVKTFPTFGAVTSHSSDHGIGYATGSGNVYCNKIVLMDEAHNLVRSQTQYADQLQRLRRLLYEAEKLVLAGFTGTPILSEPNEGRQLLDIIKGVKAPSGDEGFLSSFPMRPQPLFPVSLPRGLPDGALTLARQKQLVRRVEIRGEALKVYDLKRRLGLPGRRLRAYCNVSIFHAAFHDGRAGSKGRVLVPWPEAYPEDCCPKLLQIAQAVVAEPLKAVIMIGRTSGYVVMLELMKRLAAKAEPPFQVATMNELSEFNHVSNLRGQIFRVLVADSLQCSEGVSFLSIRKTYLADVPVSPSGFIQQCGRSIRMYGHRGLPEEEQTVTTQLYVSMLPKWMRSSSLACWALRAQKKHTRGKEVEKRARVLTARMNRAGIHSLDTSCKELDQRVVGDVVLYPGRTEWDWHIYMIYVSCKWSVLV
ncbi:Nucleoside triphosphatase I (NPH-I) (Nucleoside triphosphate phosphohydrolase I) (NPH I), partial [Durusdinium trenchii]